MAEYIRTLILNKNKLENLYFLVFAAIAFFIPIYSSISDALTYLVFILFLRECLEIFKGDHNLSKSNLRFVIIGTALFLLTLPHLIGSEFKSDILMQLDQYTALFVFPIAFATLRFSDNPGRQISKVFLMAVVGTFISTIILFISALIRYHETSTITEFYYISLGNGFHPTYLSMLTTLSLAIILDRKTLRKFITLYRPLKYIVVVVVIWLVTFNILLASKAGVIVQLMVIALFAVREFVSRRHINGIILLLLLIISVASIPTVFTFTANRFDLLAESVIYTNEDDNLIHLDEATTNSRMNGWKASFDVIKQNPLLGVGPGAIKGELNKAYIARGLGYGNRNPHNQYLQTWIELGLPGIIMLLLLGVIAAIYAFREKNYLYLAFLLIIFINMFFESILERRMGVMFFAFWNSLFWFYNLQKNNSTVIKTQPVAKAK